MKHLKYLLAAILLLSVLIIFVSVGDNQSSNDLNITDNVTQALKDAKLQKRSPSCRRPRPPRRS